MSDVRKFRKKPVIVEAVQFFVDKKPWPEGVQQRFCVDEEGCRYEAMPKVTTIHGKQAILDDGDWIIKEPDGIHFYPCKPAVFAATYEPVGGSR